MVNFNAVWCQVKASFNVSGTILNALHYLHLSEKVLSIKCAIWNYIMFHMLEKITITHLLQDLTIIYYGDDRSIMAIITM